MALGVRYEATLGARQSPQDEGRQKGEIPQVARIEAFRETWFTRSGACQLMASGASNFNKARAGIRKPKKPKSVRARKVTTGRRGPLTARQKRALMIATRAAALANRRSGSKAKKSGKSTKRKKKGYY